MSHSCILDSFTRPAPPGREGFWRRWVYEMGQPGLWKFETVNRNNRLIHDGISSIDDEFEYDLPNEAGLVWDGFYETWVPPNSPPNFSGARRVYYQWLNRIYPNGSPRIAIQLYERQLNFNSYLFDHMRENPVCD